MYISNKLNFNHKIKIIFIVIFSFLLFQSCKQDKKVIKKKAFTSPIFTLPHLPKYIVFCNEKINLEDEDTREKLDRELIINTYFQSATILAFKRANRYFPVIEKILKEEKIPDDFKYLAVIESGLSQAVSPVGAQGIWQFMPTTAKQFNLEINNEIDERLNIEKSTRAACNYLKKSKVILKDWLLVSASYNRGVNGIHSDMKWQGTNHYFDTEMNSETSRYSFRILATKLIFENPKLYGFDIDKMELYKPFKTKYILLKKSIKNIAKWSIDLGFNYKIITKLNPWIKTNKLTVKNKFYKLLIPSEKENLKPYHKYF